MNWPVFSLLVYVLLALTFALGSALELGGVRPEPVLVLVAYVALMADWRRTGWAALSVGLCLDLLHPYAGGVVLVGPYALGLLVGAFVVHQLRNVVFRHSLLTVVILTVICGLFAEVFSTSLVAVRTLPWPLGEALVGWGAADALFGGFLSVLYTAVFAVPVGLGLLALERWMRFGEGRG
ncbi:hypothetical protein [Mucisphaera sp.]|uniref:hypothetical protein n=1 Tax=Mucisphaera sp. TaxID=2913024 RepID=UPI003D0E4494